MKRHETQLTIDLECGVRVENVPLVWHDSEVCGGRVIWLCHALTANSNPEDWWPEMVGPGKPIDTGRDRVICVNMLGSPYGSFSPAGIDAATGKPRLLDFPAITVRDTVQAFAVLRRRLGIEHEDLLIGASSGGFHALEWAVSEPDLFARCLFICTAPRISPFLGATVEAQRMALEADSSFREAASLSGGAAGLRCARAQALVSYRCFRGFGLTQAEDDPDTLFAGKVGSYERYQGEKLLRSGFDAYSYYTLCNTLDSHNLGRGRGGVAAALAGVKAKVTVLNIDSDLIFPPQEGQEWARQIPGAEYVEISSDYGHDGFLLETEKIAALINA